MKIKKIISVLFLIFLFGFAGRSSAQSVPENEIFPDIPGAEKIVWHCDEGTTVAITYTKPNEWSRTIIMTQLRPYATESGPDGKTHYFVMSSDGAKFLKISFEQFKSDMEFLSPNYVKYLRGEQNDCADGKFLRQRM